MIMETEIETESGRLEELEVNMKPISVTVAVNRCNPDCSCNVVLSRRYVGRRKGSISFSDRDYN